MMAMTPFVKPDDFDGEWYLAQYPDVRLLEMDPWEHYKWLGWRLGRAICGANSQSSPNASTGNTGDSPTHNIPRHLRVDFETISKSELFDENWYKSKYKRSIINESPILHYLRIGATLGFDPGPKFSTRKYLDIYRDVKASGNNPLIHYIRHGYREGRSATPKGRRHSLGLPRFSPEETGTPFSVLPFDARTGLTSRASAETVCVHVHLFFPEMAKDIASYLANIKVPYTLLISTAEVVATEPITTFFKERCPNAIRLVVKRFPNRGRDVAPWLVGFADEIRKSTIFCHLHSKQSSHNKAHRGWFRYLAHTMLGSESVVNSILNLLSEPEPTGIIAPCYYWTLASQPNYGKNYAVLNELLQRLGAGEPPAECPDYPAGSFFWARTDALSPLLELNLDWHDFAEERGQVDGTLAHAVERCIGIIPARTGLPLRLVTVDVPFDLRRYVSESRSTISPSLRLPPRSPQKPTNKIALYTCISGGYETPTCLATHLEGIDAVMLTDNDRVSSPPGFKLRVSNYVSPTPVRTARFAKTHPHLWFPNHDFAFWCDSNVHFFGDFSDYTQLLDEQDADCGFILHPLRESFVEEAEELIEKKIITDRSLTERQVERYLNTPGVLKSPLIESNFFVCRPSSPRVKEFMNLWWREINHYTHRDQLSINYALLKSQVKWVPILPPTRSTREHPDFALFAHSVNERQPYIDFINGSDL